MDWDTLVGYVTASAAAATALGVMWRLIRPRSKLWQLLSHWRSRRAPTLRAASVQATLELEPDGTAILTRNWSGINCDRAVPAPCVPEILRSPDGCGGFQGVSELGLLSDFPKATELRTIDEHSGVRWLELAVLGGIVRGDPPLSYKHTTRIRLDSPKEVNRSNFQHPCLSVELAFPVEKMSLEVHLPAGKLAAYPIAFFSGSDYPDSEHSSVLQRNFSQNGRSAVLEITQPSIGQRYGIYWIKAEARAEIREMARQVEDEALSAS